MCLKQAIDELRTLSNKMDKSIKMHAVVQITGAAASAVGAALGIVTAVIGVLCAPLTGGASLALTAAGIAATGKPLITTSDWSDLAQSDDFDLCFDGLADLKFQ